MPRSRDPRPETPKTQPAKLSPGASLWENNKGAIAASGSSDQWVAAISKSKGGKFAWLFNLRKKAPWSPSRSPKGGAKEFKGVAPTPPKGTLRSRPTVVSVKPAPAPAPSSSVAGSKHRVTPKGKSDADAKRAAEQDRTLTELFRKYDADESGQLAFREACACVRELNKSAGGATKLAMSEIEEIYAQGDQNGDFKLELSEFKAWYLGPLSEWLEARAASASASPTAERRASSDRGAGRPYSSEERELMTAVVGKKAAPRAPAEVAKANLSAHLNKVCPSYTEDQRKQLSACYMLALTGDVNGAAGASAQSKNAKERQNQRALGEDDRSGQGHIDKARMDRVEFGKFCRYFKVNHVQVQNNLFRVCNPGSDELLTFEELKRGLAPAITGSAEQKAAFLFSMYDADLSGMVSMVELFKIFEGSQPGDPLTDDLTELMSFIKTQPSCKGQVTFDMYLVHSAQRKRRCELFPLKG